MLAAHNSLVMVLNHALGGSSGSSGPKPVDVTEGAGSLEQAVFNMNRMLQFG